ncbi:HalOD1 output domain-containing protein [Halorientalis pallida]|uniref:Halobacterial output domain-containing protein n=1 Tax=Halorientalis pallida TaxID=2479928 RepID=A0A498KZZ1_9EURY|nr:HalOD1 output domain-containing protein [Halorientalis pallida]RXK49043.1 hypothetical protein EAF64_08915 [Halorientalis pallida]
MSDRHGRDDLIPDEETGIIFTRMSPDPETAEFEFIELISSVEGAPVEELPLLYDEVDHLVERLFETPPSLDAQVEISFSYSGYRITINRSGDVKLIPVKETRE